MKKCPVCELSNPDSVLKCVCGYDYHLKSSGVSLSQNKKSRSRLQIALYIFSYLIVAGIASTFAKAIFGSTGYISTLALFFVLFNWHIAKGNSFRDSWVNFKLEKKNKISLLIGFICYLIILFGTYWNVLTMERTNKNVTTVSLFLIGPVLLLPVWGVVFAISRVFYSVLHRAHGEDTP